MNDYPDTIKHPNNFDKSQWHIVCPHCHYEIGFDGIFHWEWVIDGIKASDPKSNIMPMDFDAVIERHYHYLIIETKDEDVPISRAQSWTLTRIGKAKSFTIFKNSFLVGSNSMPFG